MIGVWGYQLFITGWGGGTALQSVYRMAGPIIFPSSGQGLLVGVILLNYTLLNNYRVMISHNE